MSVQPRPSAAVMLLRDTTAGFEIFMVRRSTRSVFMPDVYVFPGGAVQEEDLLLEQQAEWCLFPAPQRVASSDPEGYIRPGNGFYAAAIRELFEEANVLLTSTRYRTLLAIDASSHQRFAAYRRSLHEQGGSLESLLRSEQLLLAGDQLHYFSHWITPESLPKRFDAHFFVARAPEQQEAVYDQRETSAGIWISASEALTRCAAGLFELAFPTRYQLQELATFTTVAAVIEATEHRYVPTHRPVMVEENGTTNFLLSDEQA